MRLLCLISLLAIIGSQDAGGKVYKNVDVFWIPPEVQTYIPVTAEDIEKRAFKIVYIKNEGQATELIGLIEKSNQVLNSYAIRVKISTEDRFYNFDSNGIGVSSKREAVRIDLKKLKLALCE